MRYFSQFVDQMLTNKPTVLTRRVACLSERWHFPPLAVTCLSGHYVAILQDVKSTSRLFEHGQKQRTIADVANPEVRNPVKEG